LQTPQTANRPNAAVGHPAPAPQLQPETPPQLFLDIAPAAPEHVAP
jgi:hypothetical protein